MAAFKRQKIVFGAILVFAAAFYSALNPQYRTGIFNDDASYVIAAENLWDANTSPLQALVRARPDFPFPGLPLLLAPFVKLAQPNWERLEWVSIFVATLSVFLVQLFLKRWLPWDASLVLLALYAFNPTVGKYSGVIMPALYFIVAIMASFLLAEKLLVRFSWPIALTLGITLGWGSLIRPEGFLLLIGVSIVLIYNRRWKDWAAALIVPAIAWGAFISHWLKSLRSLETEYGGDLSALLAYWPHHAMELGLFSLTLLRVLFIRMLTGLTLPKSQPGALIATAISLACASVALAGFCRLWKKSPPHRGMLSGTGFFCASYFFIHMLWHVAISRYCVVLLPFALLFLHEGFHVCLRDAGQKRMWASVVCSVFFFSYVNRNVEAIRQSLWAPNPMNLPPQRSLAWIAQNIPASSQVLSIIAPNVILYAQRPAISMLAAANEEDFLYLLMTRRLDYIVDRSVRPLSTELPSAEDPGQKWDRIRRWIHAHPARYPLLFSDKVEKVDIYHVSPESNFAETYKKYVQAIERLNAGHPEGALTILNEAARASPDLGSIHNAIGVIDYLQRKDLKQAETEFLKAGAILPDYPETLLNLACLYHAEGEPAKSLAYVQRAMKVSAANGDSAQFLLRVRLTQAQGDIDLPKDFFQ